MKKIFTKRYAMAAMTAVAVFAAMTATSCTKSDELLGTKTKNTITSINANIDEGLTKVYIAPDGSTTNGKKVTWKTNDAITVINDAANASVVYTYDGTDNAKSGKFKTSGSLSASAGDQLYAFYNANGTVDAANNAISVSYTGATANDQAIWDGNTTTGDATNNSLMYAGASVASNDVVPSVTFKNANAIIKSTVTGGTAAQTFNYITVVSGNGMMPIAGTATISGTGDAVTLKWSNRTFGAVEYHSASTLNLSANNTWNQLIIPSMQYGDGTVNTLDIGPIYYLFSDAPLATATKVYYIETTNPATLVAGKSYGLSKDVKLAGIIKSDGTLSTEDQAKTLWINQAPASTDISSYVRSDGPSGIPYGITLIQANQSTAEVLKMIFAGTKLLTYINNYSTFSGTEENIYYCDHLKYISLANLTTLPVHFTNTCTALETIFLPKVTTISTNSYAFYGCTSLKKIIFGSIITSTPRWAGCYILRNVDTTQIDLVFRKGQKDYDGNAISGNVYGDLTFMSIHFMD